MVHHGPVSNQVPTRVVSFRIIAGTGESSGLTEPGLHVLRDRGDFERLWSVVQSQHSASLAAPHVDWSQETVVVVALGTRPTGGYTICDEKGKEVKKATGGAGDATHIGNFLDAIRDDKAVLNSEIAEGHKSNDRAVVMH